MSIKVAINDLPGALGDFDTAYLITVGADGRAKVISADVQAEGTDVIISNGSAGTARNLAVNSAATLLCPPKERHGLSLIVDGQGKADGDGFRIAAEHAILHRPAAHADGELSGETCGNDCRPV